MAVVSRTVFRILGQDFVGGKCPPNSAGIWYMVSGGLGVESSLGIHEHSFWIVNESVDQLKPRSMDKYMQVYI